MYFEVSSDADCRKRRRSSSNGANSGSNGRVHPWQQSNTKNKIDGVAVKIELFQARWGLVGTGAKLGHLLYSRNACFKASARKLYGVAGVFATCRAKFAADGLVTGLAASVGRSIPVDGTVLCRSGQPMLAKGYNKTRFQEALSVDVRCYARRQS